MWKKYFKNSDPSILFDDIKRKGTGWCTAGGMETAKKHINSGDFYVYFTRDMDGNFTVPRIAIRTEDDQIVEIRGVAPDQNIETNLEAVIKEKLKEFRDGEVYSKKVHDMEQLTSIYKKNKNITNKINLIEYNINIRFILA